jgi:peptide/nickel transport system permease protein
MFGVIAKRFLALLPTAIIGTIIIFSIVQLTPGGVAEAIAGPDATGEFILQIKQELGLDRPLYIQYASWLWQMVHGNFGQSLLTREYITTLIQQRLPVTATIAGEALLIALIVAIPLGIWSASRRGTAVDSTIRTVSGLGLAMPEFWIGMLGINLFALQLAWVPTTGYVPLAKGFGAHFNSTILPALTLACAPTAVLVRTTRSAMAEALEGQYVRAAWALGLSPWQIYLKFAFKNALIPIVTVIGIIASVLIGGAVLIERVFAIPGMGDLLTQGVLTKDFPIVQGTTVVLMVVVIVVNLLVDVAYVMLDPRLRA